MAVTKENPGCWTRRRAFAQVRHGSNIQLLPYALVNRGRHDLCAFAAIPHFLWLGRRRLVPGPTGRGTYRSPIPSRLPVHCHWAAADRRAQDRGEGPATIDPGVRGGSRPAGTRRGPVPVPASLVGLESVDDQLVTAEHYLPGGEQLAQGPDSADLFAGLLAELIAPAPPVARCQPLHPPRPGSAGTAPGRSSGGGRRQRPGPQPGDTPLAPA